MPMTTFEPYPGEAQVSEIGKLCAGGVRQRDIAERFGVGQSLVSMIANGKRRGESSCE